MRSFLVFLFSAVGLFGLTTALWPAVYAPAAAAIKKRSPKQITQSEIMINSFAQRLVRYIDIDPIKRVAMEEELQSLGYTISPEMFRARSLATALIYSSTVLCFIILSPLVGVTIWGVLLWVLFSNAEKKLDKEIEKRRLSIEKELPQFAGTIRQCLNTTHDVVAIMEAYRKVCGSALKMEIEKTLNDMHTGNPERALKAFEARVSSTKLSELTRGLVSVMRGDDQRIYFDMLTMQLQKTANEAVAKELQLRPQKLYPYMGLLFGCLAMIIGVALGLFMVQQFNAMF